MYSISTILIGPLLLFSYLRKSLISSTIVLFAQLNHALYWSEILLVLKIKYIRTV